MTSLRLAAAACLLLVAAGCDAAPSPDNSPDKSAGGNAGAALDAAATAPVQAPADGDWSAIVSATPQGGFVMGNRQAAVKLVEFGSMTCSHCAVFADVGERPLIEKYVRPGRVSFEFRNFVRDPFDLTAALIARCGGAKTFFPLTRALFAEQEQWIGKLQQVPPEQQQALQGQPPAQQFRTIAGWTGFQQWAAMRGLPTAKSQSCLADQAAIDRLVQMSSEAIARHQIQGTPSFLINGELVADASTWETLEPKLKAALGG